MNQIMKTVLAVALATNLILGVFIYRLCFKTGRSFDLVVLKEDMSLALRSGAINNLPRGTVLYAPKLGEYGVSDVGDYLLYKIYVRLPADHAALVETDEEAINSEFDKTYSIIHLTTSDIEADN